jgi:protoporphyrinogen oxidase
MNTKKIVIIGGGPTGLGAAYRLHELGYDNWSLYEQNDYMGGHASSHRDEQGFTWDEGGHVIFSHYPYFDRLVSTMLGEEENQLVRESWVVKGESWIPYPFQNNLRYLPKPLQLKCLLGAAKAASNSAAHLSTNFRDWILATFGEGIAEEFMFPYNLKVWTTPLEQISRSWIGERVSVVDFKRLLENVLYERDDAAWGPNNKFRFPLHGGTGEIYRRIANCFPDRVHCGKKLVEVETVQRRVSFADGTGADYDILISTAPLDLLIAMLRPGNAWLGEAAAKLKHNNLLVLGVGLEKKIATSKCWIYFANPDMPCYRGTHFSHYSARNVPGGDTDRYSSIMCEMSFREDDSPDISKVFENVISGLIHSGVLEESDRTRIVSRYHRKVHYSYPIPTLDRDSALGILQPALMAIGIYSRGRFGAWRYEIGNMDHSVIMGVEAVDHTLTGEKEMVFHSS